MRKITLCVYCLQSERNHGNNIAAVDYLDDGIESCDYCNIEYDLMECMEV